MLRQLSHRRDAGACGVFTPRRVLALLIALVSLAVAGCGATSSTAGTGSRAAQVSAPLSATTAPPAPRHHRASQRAGRRTHVAVRRSPLGLVHSTASNDVVQSQPAPSSCRAAGSGVYERPDPSCTPGALNPAVTQASIYKTICVAGWTDTVRPPESITEQEKAASIAAYGDTGSMGDYEYDHFVPLELGGATNDPRNLWPEPGASPNPKDTVEDTLREKVCAGQITLAQAQHEIVSNWTALAARAPAPRPARSQAPSTTSSPQSGHCTVTASYNSTYHDYDVYVHSNQPDKAVTVTDASGDSHSWHTDSTGYADVFFHATGGSAGEQVTARVGPATCHGTL